MRISCGSNDDDIGNCTYTKYVWQVVTGMCTESKFLPEAKPRRRPGPASPIHTHIPTDTDTYIRNSFILHTLIRILYPYIRVYSVPLRIYDMITQIVFALHSIGRELIHHASILPQSLASSLRHTSYYVAYSANRSGRHDK